MAIKQLRPMPTASLEVEPSADDIEFYRENGFLAVERITTEEELEWLTELYEHIFDAGQRRPIVAAPVDRSTGDRTTSASAVGRRQAFLPEFNYPELLQTTFNRNARRLRRGAARRPHRPTSAAGAT